MRNLIRGFLVLLFGSIFSLLISGLLAHARADDGEDFQLQIETTDKHYPEELLRTHPNLKIAPKREEPWYFRKANQWDRIIGAGHIDPKAMGWDTVEKGLFVQRLEHRGPAGVAAMYKNLSAKQIESAHLEMQKVKEGK